jgi:hypothetical protein
MLQARADALERRLDAIEADWKHFMELHPDDPAKRPRGRPPNPSKLSILPADGNAA